MRYIIDSENDRHLPGVWRVLQSSCYSFVNSFIVLLIFTILLIILLCYRLLILWW